MATYDMTPLDANDRVPLKIHIKNSTLSIDEMKMISIATDCNISELKFEIERVLSIQIQYQQKLCIDEGTHDETKELSNEDTKLSEYNISQNTIIELELSNDCDWNGSQTNIDMTHSSPKSPPIIQTPKTPSQGGKDNENTENMESVTAQTDNDESRGQGTNDEIIHFLTKHSKIQCRILLIVFEITLILLVAYWGEIQMVQYVINMIFILIGWRGCRKLAPFFIICFGLYLILDLLIIFLLIILGIVEQHESVYGSVAAYVALLTFEFILNSIWLYFYLKFFYRVLRAPPSVRNMAINITSKQPILV